MKKHACTKYLINWYLIGEDEQKMFISKLEENSVNLILIDTNLDPYNDYKKRIPLIADFINQKYQIISNSSDWVFAIKNKNLFSHKLNYLAFTNGLYVSFL